MRGSQTEILTLRPENTGGNELTFLRKMVHMEHPHVPESTVKPERVDLEALIWHNPEQRKGEKIQYVVMGGMNINAVEVHPILSMLTNHADTVVGIAHPDAPQSRITPADSPFNDKASFANSGYAVLRGIESLVQEGSLDPESPITVVGFSTGGAVLTETVAQDIRESQSPANPRKRLIESAVLLSPGGVLEMGEKEMMPGVASTGSLYWKEFVEEEIKLLKDLFKHPKKLLESLSDAMAPDNPMAEIAYAKHIWDRYKTNIAAMKRWPSDAEWRAIGTGHNVFEVFENLVRLPKWGFLDRVHAQFHRMWIDQPGWPHLSPKTPAFRRSRENVAHDVTADARRDIHDTPIIMWLGANDKAINPEKFLTTEDHAAIWRALNSHESQELKDTLIMQRAKEAFPNDSDNVHVVFAQGDHSHHLSPRADASVLELYVLRYLHPDVVKPETVYVGKS